MTDDLLERRLRSELRDLAEAVPEAAAVLEHPEGASSARRPRRRSHPRLAVAACMLLALGLTLALLSWGRMGKGVAQPASKATVEQAVRDIRDVEAGRAALRAVYTQSVDRCMAGRGYPEDLLASWYDVVPPLSPLSGQRSVDEARRDGYGIRKNYDRDVREAGLSDSRRGHYWTELDGDRLPAWSYQVPGGQRVVGWYNHLTGNENCETVALREVWGDHAGDLAALSAAMRDPLSDATAERIPPQDENGATSHGPLVWRRCMLRDRELFPHGDPAPSEALGQWINVDLNSRFGYRDGIFQHPMDDGVVAAATRREQALAVRDVECAADPGVRSATLAAERFQMEFDLRRDPTLADKLHHWRLVVDEVRAAHGV